MTNLIWLVFNYFCFSKMIRIEHFQLYPIKMLCIQPEMQFSQPIDNLISVLEDNYLSDGKENQWSFLKSNKYFLKTMKKRNIIQLITTDSILTPEVSLNWNCKTTDYHQNSYVFYMSELKMHSIYTITILPKHFICIHKYLTTYYFKLLFLM